MPPEERDPDLTTTSFVVLGMLAFGEPLSGFQIHRWAQNIRYFHPAPAHSHVYKELRRLAGHGLVAEAPGEGRDRRFAVTPAGRDRLREWVAEPEELLPRMQHPVLLRLFFSEAAGASASMSDVVRRFVEATRARAAELQELADALEGEPAFRLPRSIALWGVRFCEAEEAAARDSAALLDPSD